MFKRAFSKEILGRLREPRKFIQVLMGPRQVGKTTMVRQLLPDLGFDYIFESADAIIDPLWLEQVWESARIKIKANNGSVCLLIIDEIQKINNWSETVKKLWDEDTYNELNLKVLLLGSSRLLIQQGLSESLTGRFENMYLRHWTLSEMQAAFGWSVEQYVWFGGYPGSAELIKDEKRWKNYVSNSIIETSISKDILMLSRVHKPALMKRLFELGCLYSGQILSFSKIQGQLQDAGNTTTLSHYLHLLDTAGLLGGIEKYAANTIRKRASSPKYQVHNTALISAQTHTLFEEIQQQPKNWGRVVESAIGSHLINEALVNGYNLYYWRHRNAEVDFIVERDHQIIALEVKTGAESATKGMAAFKEKYHPHKVLLVGKSGIPWQDFLTLEIDALFD